MVPGQQDAGDGLGDVDPGGTDSERDAVETARAWARRQDVGELDPDGDWGVGSSPGALPVPVLVRHVVPALECS